MKQKIALKIKIKGAKQLQRGEQPAPNRKQATREVKDIKDVRQGVEVKDNRVLLWAERLNLWPLYLVIFLLPLFFLPWAVNVLDFQKQSLLLFLVFLSLWGWLGKVFITGRIKLRLTFLYLPLGILLLVIFLSSIFSLYQYGSFWGWPLKTNQAFFTFLGLALFFFLFLNTFREREQIVKAFYLLSASTALVAIFGIFQLFGVFLFPWFWSQSTSFNTIGTANGWALFLASLLPILVLLLSGNWKKGERRPWGFLLNIIAVVTAIAGIFLVNFWVAWIVLLAGMTLILAFGIIRGRGEEIKTLVFLPALLLAIALIFGIFRVPIQGLPRTGLELLPSYSHTLEIAGKVLREKPLLGSGPGTFSYDFSLHRSPALNKTIFWNIRFGSGAAEMPERLATFGILGFLAFLALLGSFLFTGFKSQLRLSERERSFWLPGLGLLASFFGLIVGFFLYPGNLSLEFLFWFLPAIFLGFCQEKTRTWQLEAKKFQSVIASFSLIGVLILSFVFLVFLGQRYLSQVSYYQGLRALSQNRNQQALAKILRAAQLSPSTDAYWRDLSQVAISQLQKEMARQDLTKKELSQRVQTFFNLMINAGKKATDVSPHNVANWLARGFAYRQSIGLAQGSFDWALKSYERAQELEPNNPFLFLERARVYLAQAQLMEQLKKSEKVNDNLEKAKEELDKAIALKKDYWPAHFQKAVILDAQGNLKEAIAKLEEIKPFNQQDVGLAFRLGSLYWRAENLEKAREEFERAVQLNPNFANARYFLGLIYDKQGEKKKAIAEFEKIASYSKENKEKVAEILKNLKAGKPALGEEAKVPPEPEEIPPLEEKKETEELPAPESSPNP